MIAAECKPARLAYLKRQVPIGRTAMRFGMTASRRSAPFANDEKGPKNSNGPCARFQEQIARRLSAGWPPLIDAAQVIITADNAVWRAAFKVSRAALGSGITARPCDAISLDRIVSYSTSWARRDGCRAARDRSALARGLHPRLNHSRLA